MDTVLVGVAPSPLRDVSNMTKNQRERDDQRRMHDGGLGVGNTGARNCELYIFQRDILMESGLWWEHMGHNHRMGIRRTPLLLALPLSVLMSWHCQ